MQCLINVTNHSMPLPLRFATAGLWARCLFLFVPLMLLSGCSPTYDWRELPAAGGAVQVAFPGRPATDSRELSMAGRSVTFEVAAAQAAGATFAVGHMTLPASALQSVDLPELTPDAVVDVLVQSLVRGFPPDAVSRSQVVVRRLRASEGAPVQAIEVAALQPDGLRLLARVLYHDERWIQIVALGPADRLDAETARWFVDTMRLQ